MVKKEIYSIYLPALLSGIFYFLLAYFTPRTQFVQLISLVSACFVFYIFLCRQLLTFKTGLSIAITFRFIFILAYPQLSDDYFRFYWDGTLFLNGENPYLHLPSFYLEPGNTQPGLPQELFAQLNSPAYYSVYPPVCQFIFALAKLLANNNIYTFCIILRFLIIAAEIASLLLMRKILFLLRLPEKQIWLYGFNPLVILELTGNLHFEAFVILALLISIYFLLQNKTSISAIALGLAVSIKLLPLIFLPPLLKYLGWKRFMVFTVLVAGVITISFIPFISQDLISHIADSINLYFQKFEFNASIYYLLRWLGYLISGYNQIAVLGPLLGLTVLVTVLYLTGQLKTGFLNLLKVFLISLSVYFFMATVVHSWYLTTLVVLAAFINWKYSLVWSYVVFLSYSAYQTASYQENLYLVTLEYTIITGTIIYEFYRQRKKNQLLTTGSSVL